MQINNKNEIQFYGLYNFNDSNVDQSIKNFNNIDAPINRISDGTKFNNDSLYLRSKEGANGFVKSYMFYSPYDISSFKNIFKCIDKIKLNEFIVDVYENNNLFPHYFDYYMFNEYMKCTTEQDFTKGFPLSSKINIDLNNPLAAGGFGNVYNGFVTDFQKKVIVKIPKTHNESLEIEYAVGMYLNLATLYVPNFVFSYFNFPCDNNLNCFTQDTMKNKT